MPTKDILNDSSILEAALEGLELKRARLDDQIAEIRARLGRRPGSRPSKVAVATGAAVEPTRRKRRFSAKTRKRMSEAQKRRYAEEKEKHAQAQSAVTKAARRTVRKKTATKGAKQPARKSARKTAPAAAAPTV